LRELDAFFSQTIKWLVEQGILGMALVALAWAYWSCRGKVDLIYQERLGDFRATLETIHANNAAISDVVEATRARTEASTAIAEAQKMLTAEHTRSTTEILRLREVIGDLEKEVQALRTELVRRGIA
jgi:predicted negative regulator of RcsB-dependent stress response